MDRIITLVLLCFIANPAWSDETDATSMPSANPSQPGTAQETTKITPQNNAEENGQDDVEYIYIVTQLA